MFDAFFLKALAAGLGAVVAAAPLGCFVVWRRMAYFGDATAHAALLGVAAALATDLPVVAGVVVVALGTGLGLVVLTRRGHAADTALGVISHGALATGLVAVSLLPGVQVDLSAWLFGDILAVTNQGLLVIWTGALAVVGLLAWRWQRLLMVTLSGDMAYASGIRPAREELALTLALALLVAVAIKVVGALLIGALLIIPAAAARPLARTPEAMAVGAAAIGALSVVAGLGSSLATDSPAGPSIVVAAMLAFLLTGLLRRT